MRRVGLVVALLLGFACASAQGASTSFPAHVYAPEKTTPADAQQVLDYATATGVNTLSIWAIQRDNGGCPGVTGSNSCSGIVQNTWDFTHLLQPFTG